MAREMNREGWDFLEELISTGAPGGAEQRIQRLLYARAEKFADRIDADLHGNLSVVINPGATRRVMLAAHCDRIAFMVMQIEENGYIHLDAVGGVDESTVLGATVVIHGQKGDITGVLGKTASHNQSEDERSKVPKLDTMWVDIGCRDKEEVEKLVSLGDYVTFAPTISRLRNNRIAAPALDNCLGLWAVMETARRCAAAGKLDVALYCVSTVQEEIGSRGADTATSQISPDIAIAVDTTLAIDDPSRPQKVTAPTIRLDAGPSISAGPNTNPALARLLTDAADRAGVDHQREPNPSPESNDAKAMQIADGGAAALSVGIPIRNMHTQVEVASLRDVEATAAMLTEFVRTLRSTTDLLPINHGLDKPLELHSPPHGKTARYTPHRSGDNGVKHPRKKATGRSG